MDVMNFPPEYEAIFFALAREPEEVRAMWRYAMVLMMIDDEKARIVETHQEGDTLRLFVRTLAGDSFEVLRPPMSDEVEQMLLEQIRKIVDED